MGDAEETLAARLQREGALGLEDVLRVVPPICDVLVKLADAGAPSTVTLTSVHLFPEAPPRVTPVPFGGTARELVKQVAALTYELLKGLPAPESPASADFIGLRPEIVRPVHAALVGTGASDLLTFARQLRALGSGGTAQIEKLVVPDTKVSDKAPAVTTAGRVGQIFGAYQLVRRLGEGGMGEVYVGRHTRLGREVAIKVLRDEYASMPDVVQRFFQEARVVNELGHPNTVEILDFVEEPGRVYLVMELLEGRTIAELDQQEGPLRVARIAKLLAQACGALEAAHRLGVIHRDIKPENLFVLTNETVKVLDFGVARRLTGAPQTQAGLVLGTPFYMAPEQAAGRAVDARADVYALGVTLYELLSRDSMSTVTTPQRLLRAASGEPVPQALTTLVASMLSLDPSQRPASVEQVRAVLEQLAAAPPPALAPSTGQALASAGLGQPRSSSRRWLLLALVAVVVAIVAVTQRSAEAPPPPVVVPPAPPVAVTTPLEKVTPPPPEPDPKPVKPKLLVKPPATPAVEPPPADPLAPFRPRIADVRRRFDTLVRRYGQEQLTTLEKATVAEALANAAGAPTPELDVALTDAEHALAEAERRLGR
ncbi:MAG: serine/threonine protein kinase [Archangium sp.]|nr:serine/threonine protein kinase [Archangium sp.]